STPRHVRIAIFSQKAALAPCPPTVRRLKRSDAPFLPLLLHQPRGAAKTVSQLAVDILSKQRYFRFAPGPMPVTTQFRLAAWNSSFRAHSGQLQQPAMLCDGVPSQPEPLGH